MLPNNAIDHELTGLIGWHSRPEKVGAFNVLRTAFLLIVVRLALIVLDFQKTAAIVNRWSGAGELRISKPARVEETKYTVSLAAAFIPARILCLERSLVLYYELKRGGVPAAHRLGVRAYPFAAHAWVELDGSPVNETPDFLKDFKPILELR